LKIVEAINALELQALEPNITTIMPQKQQLQKSLCKHVTKQRKHIAMYKRV